MPSQALEEDWETVQEILRLRTYARAKTRLDAPNTKDEDLEGVPMVETVYEVMNEIREERNAKRVNS